MGVKAVYRLVILMLIGLLALSAGVSYVGWRNMREENTELELGKMRLDDQKKSLLSEKEYKQEYYRRLIFDEAFAARVIREKMGFAEPDEIIFRFEDTNPLAGDEKNTPVEAKVSTPVAAESAADKAERDGASYLRSTLLDRIFAAAKKNANDGYKKTGVEIAVANEQQKTEDSKNDAKPSPAQSPKAPPQSHPFSRIKTPSGPVPIVFRNI